MKYFTIALFFYILTSPQAIYAGEPAVIPTSASTLAALTYSVTLVSNPNPKTFTDLIRNPLGMTAEGDVIGSNFNNSGVWGNHEQFGVFGTNGQAFLVSSTLLVWQVGSTQLLPGLGSRTWTYAASINDGGLVVGSSCYQSETDYTGLGDYFRGVAVLWDHGHVTDLNSVLPQVPVSANSSQTAHPYNLVGALAINDQGQILCLATPMRTIKTPNLLFSIIGQEDQGVLLILTPEKKAVGR